MMVQVGTNKVLRERKVERHDQSLAQPIYIAKVRRVSYMRSRLQGTATTCGENCGALRSDCLLSDTCPPRCCPGLFFRQHVVSLVPLLFVNVLSHVKDLSMAYTITPAAPRLCHSLFVGLFLLP